MKTKLAILAALILSLSQAAYADGGEREGNGGDTTDEASFMDTCMGIEAFLRSHPSLLPDSIRNEISSRVYTLDLYFMNNVDTVPCEGATKKACNYPDENRIVVARNEWQRMRGGASRFERDRLVVHELLGLAGATDVGYALSGRLVNAYIAARAELAARVDTDDATVLHADEETGRALILIEGRVYTGYYAHKFHRSSDDEYPYDAIRRRTARRLCRNSDNIREVESQAMSACALAANPSGCRLILTERNRSLEGCAISAVAVDLTEHVDFGPPGTGQAAPR